VYALGQISEFRTKSFSTKVLESQLQACLRIRNKVSYIVAEELVALDKISLFQRFIGEHIWSVIVCRTNNSLSHIINSNMWTPD